MLRKKIVSLLAISALMLTIFPHTAGAQETTFTDLYPWHENAAAIEFLQDEEIVVGYPDGTFGISQDINRAEFLKLVMEADLEKREEAGEETYEITGENCFPDVKKEWFAPYVCTAKAKDVVHGDAGDGLFHADRPINFAEASKIIANVNGLPLDESLDEVWFQPFVVALEDVSAIPNSVFAFDHNLNRSEMSELVVRLIEDDEEEVTNTYANIKEGKTVAEPGGRLQTFESCTELDSYVQDNYEEPIYFLLDDAVFFDGEDDDGFAEESIDAAPRESAGQSTEDLKSASDADVEYSETNVQVQGVDESDIVKTDGNYIYYVRQGEVEILDANPLERLSTLEFGDDGFYTSEVYLDGDRLVVVGSTSRQEPTLSADIDYYYNYWDYFSKVYFIDISDRSNPTVVKDFEFEGSTLSSRKVDDRLYFVMNVDNYGYVYDNVDVDLPVYYSSASTNANVIADCSQVKYVPGAPSTDFLYVIGISMDDDDYEVDSEVVMGGYGDVYASRDNLYVAQPKYYWGGWADSGDQTVVHKFSLGEDLAYQGKGVVPGNTLNQFSMDENKGFFRIATTKWDINGQSNGLYILDENLDAVGWVENIAPNETIYSVRFIGDRAYMVTFRNVDPLFSIDVSDPKNPEIMGELKIPGVSDYLHPFGEDYLIGFGREAEDNPDFFTGFQGIKIAMFDVSDIENPDVVFEEKIGVEGSHSDLIWNHKALLFDQSKGIMAFPITVTKPTDKSGNEEGREEFFFSGYETEFQGAYVYDVSEENGFELRGRISHFEDDEMPISYGNKAIDRIIFAGANFFTLSDAMVKANDMDDLQETGRASFEN